MSDQPQDQNQQNNNDQQNSDQQQNQSSAASPNDTHHQQQQAFNPNRPRRILMMGPNDGGKTSMAKVIFENWEPARTQYQGKTQATVPEDIFLFGRKLFTFFDCGGQVGYFDDYLRDPFLFNDVVALVFVVDATLFFLGNNQEDASTNGVASVSNSNSGTGRDSTRTWNPQTIRDIFGKIVRTLLLRSPGARVFIMLNKMDKVFNSVSSIQERDQIDNLLNEQGRRLQRVAYESIVAHNLSVKQQQQPSQKRDGSNIESNQPEGSNLENTFDENDVAQNQNSFDETNSEQGPPGSGQTSNLVAPNDTSAVENSQEELERIIPLFKTSIFNNSILHAWSIVVTRLIEPSSALHSLRDWLQKIRESANGEILEAALLDSSTLLCIASTSAFSPVVVASSSSTSSNYLYNNMKSPTLSSEIAIRAKRQRLKGLESVCITHPNYSMVWKTCIPDRLQLLLVGDGRLTTPGVTQHNAELLVDWFNARFVEESSRFPPPWPVDVVQVRQLLGTL